MENKKTAIIISSIAILLFIAVTFIFLYEPTRTKITNLVKPNTGLPVLECNYEDQNTIYPDAIEKKDINICSCIEEEQSKNQCKGAVTDMNLYDRAMNQLDDTLCDNILSETDRESCNLVVQSALEQFEENESNHVAGVYMQSHNEKAIEEYEKIIVDSDDINDYINLALAYAEKGLKEQESGSSQIEYVEEAFRTIGQAKQIDENNSEVYRVEAYISEIEPNLYGAIELYDKSIELDKANGRAYAGRGHVHRMLGIFDQAVEDFEQAAKLDKNNENVYIYTNLCNLEYSRSNYEKAIKNCNIATNAENADPVFKSEAYQIMAEIFKNKDDLVQAENYLQKAKAVTPNDPNAYIAASKLYLFNQKFKEAETSANQAIEIAPTKALAYLALANAVYMQGEYENAIMKAQEGMNLVKDDVSLLEPNKPAAERDLNYTISSSYKNLGDEEKQKEYEQRAEDAFVAVNDGVNEDNMDK